MKPDSTELMLELNEINSSRRGFFRAISRGVAQSIEEPTAPETNSGRPLGAVEEALFQRLCSQCGECIKACPQGILAMEVHGPVMDLTLNHCDFCQACIQACPTQALNSLQTTDTGWRPHFNQSCNGKLFGNCQECIDDCPQHALTLPIKSTPQVNQHCNGCGACASSCYTSALTMVAT